MQLGGVRKAIGYRLLHPFKPPLTEGSMMRKKTIEEFISKAKSVHNNKYTYDHAVYVGDKYKVTITCIAHGDFNQAASSHLQGHGCPSCKFEKNANRCRSTKEDFSKKAIDIHGDKYDYSLVEYKNSQTKVNVMCEKHGVFAIIPSNHLRGKGCPGCAGDKLREIFSLGSDEFIRKSRNLHGDKYGYSMVDYRNSTTKVTIQCPEHGAFSMLAGNHLAGQGCPGCAKTGFDQTKDGFVYFLIGNGAVKVGITHKPRIRTMQLRAATPFDFHLIAKVKTTGTEAMRKEKYYHDKYESAGLTGFDGATEWLRYSPELMNEIMNENPSI